MTAITLPGGSIIEGSAPIVILGPNGSGKTQLAAQLAGSNAAEFVNALRNIQLTDQLSSQSLAQVTSELQNEINNRRNNYWELANEIHVLFRKLLAEDAAVAIQFRDAYVAGDRTDPKETTLTRVRQLWSEVFPGRKIAFADGAPKVTTEYAPSGAATYSASRMSDGERVALYLAGRVLNVGAKTVVVDEPEVHFHSRLAVRFWDALEVARPDLRFVYVTHDLAFALSRASARYVLVQPNKPPQVLSIDESLPPDIARSVLGAASFSVYAERIVFCEGTESGADYRLLAAWMRDRRTAVIPVGSCQDVIRCCRAFNESNLVTGLTAEGVVDRDYWSDAFLAAMPADVQPLEVHEVESLYCRPGVVKALATHLGKDAESAIAAFDADARNKCSEPGLLNKQALERAKTRIEPYFIGLVASAKSHVDPTAIKATLAKLTDKSAWPFDPVTVFNEELTRLTTATKSGSLEDLLRLFPGKPLLPIAGSALGVPSATMIDLVHSALRSTEGELLALGGLLQAALTGLPRRALAA